MATDYPPTHTLIYGDSGSGKSTVAATWPKPMLVMAFDPRGKEMPYLRVGSPEPEQPDGSRIIRSAKTGNPIIKIERYNDVDPTQPTAYPAFMRRMSALPDEYAVWRTIVLDSVTFMELASRKYQQYTLNPSAKDPRQWYGGSTEQLEEMLMIRFGSLPMNVVVIAHVDEDKDEVHGTYVRNPSAPGRLRKRMPSAFAELYRAYLGSVESGEREHR